MDTPTPMGFLRATLRHLGYADCASGCLHRNTRSRCIESVLIEVSENLRGQFPAPAVSGQTPIETRGFNEAQAVCLDCGLDYSAFGMDVLLPRWQWLLIHPDEGGLLCARCIVLRASRLPGAVGLEAVIGIAPSKGAAEYPNKAGTEAIEPSVLNPPSTETTSDGVQPDSSIPSAPVASASKELAKLLRQHRLDPEVAGTRMPWAKDWPLDRLMCAAADVLDFSSVPSARTVTRYTLLDDSVLDVNSGRAITVYGGTEVYLASEVDPLLSSLADLKSKMIERDKWLDDFERIDVARNDELVALRTSLAEREYEIKGVIAEYTKRYDPLPGESAVDLMRSAIDECASQRAKFKARGREIDIITARAEAAEATLAQYRARYPER